ncbi:DUF427 domain-containing protein [Muricauda sp. JGD-17]|uniref:DUF427 domain-containing protein n=1 Tax=Flagellimonas ochracea TaxID=2696472 RepID=A0A964TC31_9FLAO|nr:DUF427 domain-containing protein [Allomuricauda ochracea]NAY91514.1 DUF427 domain-containing protein [Allomuricauda ochracea]
MGQNIFDNEVPHWILKAREKWEYFGQARPPFAEIPKAGQRSVWDFPRPPAIEKSLKKLKIKHGAELVAASHNALAILETASPSTYYVPPEDINYKLLVKIPKRESLCEWKGNAVYWALKNDPMAPIAWSYPKPFQEYIILKDYFAFYPQHLECYLDGERIVPQTGEFYAGWITSDLSGPFKGKPGTGHW